MTPSPGLRPPGLNTRRALLVYVALLMLIPSELVVGPLGAAGTPAGILGVIFLMWWLASLAATPLSEQRSNPVKWLLAMYVGALLLSYLAGMGRPIVTGAEVSSSDRYLLALFGWVGVALVVIDGTVSRARLDALLKAVCGGAVVIGLLGALQFFFGIDLAHLIQIPGLSANRTFGELQARSSFRRVSGTTSHPIEFGVILSTVLPLAVHYARFASSRASQMRWWAGVAVTAGALPLSVARSGILGAAVALACLFFTWPVPFRRKALVAIAAGMALMSVVVPGLLGTFRSIIFNAGSDPSTHGRTEDYGPVLDYVAEAPIFGRGPGTFIPSLYRTLDNHYLGVLVEAGIVGLVATLALFCGSLVVAQVQRRRARDDDTRDLAQSLTASIAVLAVSAATFDMFGFSMCAGLVFLLIGSIGALRAVSTPAEAVPLQPVTGRVASGALALGLAVVAAGAAVALFPAPQYLRYSSILFQPPVHEALPALSNAGRAGTTASLVQDVVESQAVRADLADRGARSFDLASGDGSLMRGSDRIGYKGPVLKVVTRGSSAEEATLAMQAVTKELNVRLSHLQDQVGVAESERVHTQVLSADGPYRIENRRSRVAGAAVLLSLAAVSWFLHLARRRRASWGRTLAPDTPAEAAPGRRGLAAARRGS